MSDLQDRVLALERRVTELEDQGRDRPGSVTTVAEGTFWALDGLTERVPAPGAVLIVGDVTLPGGGTARWQEGLGTEDLLARSWDRAADSLAALGHRVRLELMRQVLGGQDTARELTAVEGMGSSGQVYHHLRQLVSAGWLQSREGHYAVPADRLVPLLSTVLGGQR